MFPYKFAPHSQKKDTNLAGASFGGPLKRSNLNASLPVNATLGESMAKRIFDGDLSQSFSPHDVGSYTYGNRHHIPEVADSNPPISATRTAFRLRSEPTDICLKPHALTSSVSFSRDDSKKFVKVEAQELDQNTSPDDADVEVFYRPLNRLRDLQNELSQQRDYATDLESRLAIKQEENATLTRDLARMEAVHKQEMNKHNDLLSRATKNYSALKSELDDFKVFSQSSSLVVSEAKVTMESLATLRDSTQSNLRDLEAMFDDEGRFILSAETRETVHELRSELSKTQQVADLLRDKLHTISTELAEARSRILELEELTTMDRNRSESTALNIRQSADQMMEVMRYLQEQKHESIEATAKAYEMEQQLMHTRTRLEEAQSMITSLKEEVTAREELHQEQGAKLRTLNHTIELHEGDVKALRARARTAEEELAQALNRNHELHGRLDSATGLEKSLTQQASRLLSERDEVKERLQSIECQLAEVQSRERSLSSDMAKTLIERDAAVDKLKMLEDLKREVNVYREKYAGCQISVKVLQERFDDQCVALAAAKESMSDLQERLYATERHATETSVESKRELIYLQEQNGVLKAGLDRASKEAEGRSASFQALQNELSRKEGMFQALLETERLGKKDALNQMQEAKIKIESLLAELAQEHCRAQEMAKHIAAVEAPFTECEREVEALKVRIAELEANEKKLVDRAANISHRYENSDLNDDEKGLVALLMRKARAIHDREMVEKTNEIKRRDSIIKESNARIEQLESLLARWMGEPSTKSTDEQSNSVATNATKAQELSSDYQPDIRGVAHEAPSTTVTHGAADGASVDLCIPGPSSRSTDYSTFAKLCREDTDDIADFEDESLPVATRKRVTFAEDEPSRPARRLRHSKGTGVEKAVIDQTAAPAPTTNKKKPASKRR